jgi:Ku protein
MAPRSSWRGYLRLSLVTCPVAMLPATSEAEKVRFHTLNRATGNRVQSHYVDAETGKPVEDEDQVKGYERDEGHYIMMLEDEELDAVALESARTIAPVVATTGCAAREGRTTRRGRCLPRRRRRQRLSSYRRCARRR